MVTFTESYQMDMLRNLRKVNVDYHTVGWYQSTYLHNHINKEFLESHRKYQEVNEESIVLVYGPCFVAMVTLVNNYFLQIHYERHKASYL